MSTPAPPGRRRSRVRTILRWTLLGLGLVVLALALGLFPQEPLRRFMERQIRSAVGPHSRIGRLHIVPARLQVEVYDLVVEGPAYRLEVPRARVAARKVSASNPTSPGRARSGGTGSSATTSR